MQTRHSFLVVAALLALAACAGSPAALPEGDDADAPALDALAAPDTLDPAPELDAVAPDVAAADVACDIGKPPSKCCGWHTICQTVSGCASGNAKADCPPNQVCEMANGAAQCALPQCALNCYKSPGSYCETSNGSPQCVVGTQVWPPQDVQFVYKFWIEDKTLACDLTGDGKPDNALAGASSLIGSNLQDAVNKGAMIFLLQATNWDKSGKPFVIGVLQGDADPVELANAVTPYLTARDISFHLPACTAAGCPAQVSFLVSQSGAQLTGTENPAVDLPAFLPAAPTKMRWAATVAADGALTGHVCGALRQDKLADVYLAMTGQAMPPDAGGKTLFKLDVDTDGDGIVDAFSFAFAFKTKRAFVTGMTPP